MTEIREQVLEVLRKAELSDIADSEEWKKTFKQLAVKAVTRKVCNRTMVQETVQFTETATRDTDIVVMTVSWIEKVEQTRDMNLQTATCIKKFGNVY